MVLTTDRLTVIMKLLANIEHLIIIMADFWI